MRKAAKVQVTTAAAPPQGFSSSPGRSRTIPMTAPRTAVGRAQLHVTFVTGSAQITDSGLHEASKFLSALLAPSLAGKKFRIEGHTDAVGSREANIELSKRRAQTVVEYLIANGSDASRFEVVGYGPDKPLAGFGPSAGANRRVEIVLVQ